MRSSLAAFFRAGPSSWRRRKPNPPGLGRRGVRLMVAARRDRAVSADLVRRVPGSADHRVVQAVRAVHLRGHDRAASADHRVARALGRRAISVRPERRAAVSVPAASMPVAPVAPAMRRGASAQKRSVRLGPSPRSASGATGVGIVTPTTSREELGAPAARGPMGTNHESRARIGRRRRPLVSATGDEHARTPRSPGQRGGRCGGGIGARLEDPSRPHRHVGVAADDRRLVVVGTSAAGRNRFARADHIFALGAGHEHRAARSDRGRPEPRQAVPAGRSRQGGRSGVEHRTLGGRDVVDSRALLAPSSPPGSGSHETIGGIPTALGRAWGDRPDQPRQHPDVARDGT